MVKFKFYVPCKGWAAGGFENAHFANSEDEAKSIVKRWNEEGNKDGKIVITSIKHITLEEFAEDYIY